MQNTAQPLNEMLVSKSLSAADYVPTLDAMLSRTLARIALKKEQGLRTPDELWIVDHNDVYTLGQAGKEEHILQRTNTPIIKTDRGGQVTWHGHGQLVIYWLFDLESLGWSVRNMVSHAEQAIEDVINDCLKSHASNSVNTSTDISAHARRDAPGVYLYSHLNTASNDKAQPLTELPTDDAIMLGKIASLGFKIKHGFSYHGVAINLDCDLSAFNAINPCGYAGMQMLRLADFVAMDQQTQDEQTADEQLAVQTAEQSMQAMTNCLSYEQVTKKLIDNIAKRHAGHIQLRALAPK
ncbi:lipoyl protein ligase domain-containing protein [Psychrobacter faecalis]|uniref:lipoyl protein ligase domain-containing protein n=1 Tax=Psychrobacter TaxID=497 RepID=UPI000C7A6BE6|nr:octanoyltransferase [Psychrobacter sp. Sarcosine-02u-2]PKG88791.1 octanoyltransferase [Psychrobacter sp. Sarcosine-02u-2]